MGRRALGRTSRARKLRPVRRFRCARQRRDFGRRRARFSRDFERRDFGRIVRQRALNHLNNRRDAADRFFGKTKTNRNGAQKFAVDINRRTAHALDDAALTGHDRAVGHADHHQVAAAVDAFERAQHFDAEFLDFGALKHAQAVALHAAFGLARAHDFAFFQKLLDEGARFGRGLKRGDLGGFGLGKSGDAKTTRDASKGK